MHNKKLLWCAAGLMGVTLMLTSCSSKPQVKGALVRKEGQGADLGEIQVGP
jgi:hypothetical protein